MSATRTFIVIEEVVGNLSDSLVTLTPFSVSYSYLAIRVPVTPVGRVIFPLSSAYTNSVADGAAVEEALYAFPKVPFASRA